jgi:Chaperone of endosialidase
MANRGIATLIVTASVSAGLVGMAREGRASPSCQTTPPGTGPDYCVAGFNSTDGTRSQNEIGVYGQATNGGGVWGADTADGVGVLGSAQFNSGVGIGVAGVTFNDWVQPASGTYGVYGASIYGTGVYGQSSGNAEATGGVVGINESSSSGGNGVYGQATAGYGVSGYDTTDGFGVYGSSVSGTGVYGLASGSTVSGVEGYNSSTGNGVYGVATGGYGVSGRDTTTGYGVYGSSSSGTGVYGTSTSNNGMEGVTASSSASGVWGNNTNSGGGYGVAGTTTGSGFGIYGSNTSGSGWAGYFNGDVSVSACLYVYGTKIAGNCLSDQRLKKNIKPVRGALEQLVQLQGVTYEWKEPATQKGDSKGTETGFIAQEVERISPKWVGENVDGFKTLNIPPREFAALEVEAFKALKDRADKAEARADKLEARLETLEANRRPLISGLTAEGTLFGVGFVTMAGAFVVTRRKRSESQG